MVKEYEIVKTNNYSDTLFGIIEVNDNISKIPLDYFKSITITTPTELNTSQGITTKGVLTVKDGHAIITSSRESKILKRHISKTISYRIVATSTTIGTAIWFGVGVEVSALLGVGEVLIKPILYFIHERAWYKHRSK